MDSKDESGESMSSNGVLAACLGGAVLFWLWWMVCGLALVHGQISGAAESRAKQLSAEKSLVLQRSIAPSPDASQAPPPMPAQKPEPSELLDRAALMAEFGQTGDVFGVANSAFAAIAGALLVWAGVLQARTLAHARKSYWHEREARKREQFEQLFFRMLDLTRELTNRIETRASSVDSRVRVGPAALDAFADTIFRSMGGGSQTNDTPARELVGRYLDIYRRRPSALGPYFRLLFQTFKAIAESGLHPDEQIRYSNIARGQISDGAVLLLALNGMTSTGRKFIRYIEQYGLLEHMLDKHRQRLKSYVEEGYRQRAFEGSKKRGAFDSAKFTPKQADPNFFHPLNPEMDWPGWAKLSDQIGTDSD